jgi:hypothetical protein
MKQVYRAITQLETRQRRREDNDNLYALRAFSLEVGKVSTDYGQKHLISVVPLKSHTIQSANRRELGDICLGNGDEGSLKAGELWVPEEHLVARHENVDFVWKKLFDYLGEQEGHVMCSAVWSEWEEARKAVSADLKYFAGFKRKEGAFLVPSLDVRVYFTGMPNHKELSKVFEQ